MIHYTCDMCGRPMCSDELRYAVEIQVHAVQDPIGNALDPDFDALDTLNEMLDQAPSEPGELLEGELQTIRLDLCPGCRKRFVKNPLSRETASHPTGFSSN